MEDTIKFYNTLFQFEYNVQIDYPTFQVVFLKNIHDENVRLELILLNSPNNNNSSGVIDHICFETTDFDLFIQKYESSNYANEELTITKNSLGLRSTFITGVNNERIQVLEQKQ